RAANREGPGKCEVEARRRSDPPPDRSARPPRGPHRSSRMPVKFSRDVLKGTTKNTAGDFNQQSRFTVEIDGVTQGGIHKVDGLDHEHEMVAYQDADDHFQRIRPGRQKVGTLMLERDW